MAVAEEYTLRFLNSMEPLLCRIPPAYYVGGLLGIINSCLFYLRFGHGLMLFFPFLVVGCAGAILGLTVGTQLPEMGPSLGDVNLVATVAACWIALFIARSLRA